MTEETTQNIYVPIITSGFRHPYETYIHNSYTSELGAYRALIPYLFDMQLLTFEDYCDYKTNSKYAKKDRLSDFDKQIYDTIDLGCECECDCNCWIQQICDYINTAEEFDNICHAFSNGYNEIWTYKIHKLKLV